MFHYYYFPVLNLLGKNNVKNKAVVAAHLNKCIHYKVNINIKRKSI